MAKFLVAAVWPTWRRSALSFSPASAVLRHGSVETSSTDSISSGLISPDGADSSNVSIAFTSSSVSASRIISSSSTPIVYAGPVNACSTRRSLTSLPAQKASDGPESPAPGECRRAAPTLRLRADDHYVKDGEDGPGIRRKAVHPGVRPPRLVPEEDVRHRGRPDAGGDPDDRRRQAADLRGHAGGGPARGRGGGDRCAGG